MVRERGSGITPPRVVELLKKEVSEKSILAVSKSTGLGLAAIGRYLKGIGEPTTATLEKLASYFGVSVASLRGENYLPVILVRKDPCAAGDALPTAEIIAKWLRENAELRREVEKLLAARPLGSENN